MCMYHWVVITLEGMFTCAYVYLSKCFGGAVYFGIHMGIFLSASVCLSVGVSVYLRVSVHE